MTNISPYTNINNYGNTFLKNVEKKYYEDSIMDILDKNKDFSIFSLIVKRANLEHMLNDIYSEYNNFTLFVPTDKYLSYIPMCYLVNLDPNISRKLVLSSILDNKIPIELLETCISLFVPTKQQNCDLYINKRDDNKVYINNSKIVDNEIICKNGIIHIVDNFIFE